MPLDAHQQIGFEVECADCTLQLKKKSTQHYGFANNDTYGHPVMETGQAHPNTGHPLVQVVLEERKGTADPKIEVVTAPWSTQQAELRRLKAYINAVVDAAEGKTAAQWAQAANRIDYRPASTGVNRIRYTWNVCNAHANNGRVSPLKFHVKDSSSGSRLAQCNVDLYVAQWYTLHTTLKSMMDGPRKRMYQAARVLANTLRTAAGQPTDAVLAGVLTMALYSSTCEYKYKPKSKLARASALAKDRIQPLPKCGPADLARLVLDNAQRTALLNITDFLIIGDPTHAPNEGEIQRRQHGAANGWLSTFSKACSVSSARDQKLEQAVCDDFQTWFGERLTVPIRHNNHGYNASRYTRGNLQWQTRKTGGGLVVRDKIGVGLTAWDTMNGNWVETIGSKVWWGGGSPGTPTGKPVFPRVVNGRVSMVVEARSGKRDFNKQYWVNIR